MATEKKKFTTVNEYIKSFPEDVQFLLEVIRDTIKAAAPLAEEVISYNIPAFKFHGMLIFYSAYKNHISLSIPPSKVYEVFKYELAEYNVSKSAIQLPYGQRLPLQLITDMTKFRLNENSELAQKKAKKKKDPVNQI